MATESSREKEMAEHEEINQMAQKTGFAGAWGLLQPLNASIFFFFFVLLFFCREENHVICLIIRSNAKYKKRKRNKRKLNGKEVFI